MSALSPVFSWFLACSVCFGDPGSAATKGLKMGVFFLLAVILFVLAAIAWTGIVWVRRAKDSGGF